MARYLTVSCKLCLTPAQRTKAAQTLTAFSNACTYINEHVEPKIRNKLQLQSQSYHEVRQQYPTLPADLVVAAMGRVAASRKAAHERKCTVKQFRPTSANFNTKAFRIQEDQWMLSINLIGGREKKIPLHLGNYQREKLRGTKPVSAVLVRRRDDNYFLNVQIQVEPQVTVPSVPKRVLGVTFGIATATALSTGEEFSGQRILDVRDRYTRVRSSLQRKASKGTRTTRRNCRKVMKRLSGKERRFATWVNHTLSTAIVRRATAAQAAIALQDLLGVRERKNKEVVEKTSRRHINTWAFHQLRSFIEYKAALAGIAIVPVKGDPEDEGLADISSSIKIGFLGAARKPAWTFTPEVAV